MEAPPGFVLVRSDDAEMCLRADAAAALTAARFDDPESLRPEAVRHFRGRGRPFAVVVPGLGSVFVRGYLHGGALGAVTKDRFASDARFAAELRAHLAAAAAAVPVCEALGVVVRRGGLGTRRGWLLLREVVGASDLLAWLEASPRPAARRLVLAEAGRAIRALHDAGWEHGDLHWKNLLVTAEGRVLVVDLDGAVPHSGSLPRERRIEGLFRFDRFAAKQNRAGAAISRTDRLRVLRSCAGSDWPARDELRVLAKRLAHHIARHAAVPRGVSAGSRS